MVLDCCILCWQTSSHSHQSRYFSTRSNLRQYYLSENTALKPNHQTQKQRENRLTCFSASLQSSSPADSPLSVHDVTSRLKFVNMHSGDISCYEQTSGCGLLVAPALGAELILIAGSGASYGRSWCSTCPGYRRRIHVRLGLSTLLLEEEIVFHITA